MIKKNRPKISCLPPPNFFSCWSWEGNTNWRSWGRRNVLSKWFWSLGKRKRWGQERQDKI